MNDVGTILFNHKIRISPSNNVDKAGSKLTQALVCPDSGDNGGARARERGGVPCVACQVCDGICHEGTKTPAQATARPAPWLAPAPVLGDGASGGVARWSSARAEEAQAVRLVTCHAPALATRTSPNSAAAVSCACSDLSRGCSVSWVGKTKPLHFVT